MNSKLKLVARPRRVSVRLFTAEEIKGLEGEDLKSPLCYGAVRVEIQNLLVILQKIDVGEEKDLLLNEAV